MLHDLAPYYWFHDFTCYAAMVHWSIIMWLSSFPIFWVLLLLCFFHHWVILPVFNMFSFDIYAAKGCIAQDSTSFGSQRFKLSGSGDLLGFSSESFFLTYSRLVVCCFNSFYEYHFLGFMALSVFSWSKHGKNTASTFAFSVSLLSPFYEVSKSDIHVVILVLFFTYCQNIL